MTTRPAIRLSHLALAASLLILAAVDIPEARADKAKPPVKVFILSGQSNMVGAGKVDGGGVRWGTQFTDPVVSVYEGSYNPDAAYDTMTPVATQKLAAFGGTEPTAYPGGGTQVVRGFFTPEESGIYEFRPGYGDSTYNIMAVNGQEVYRREVGNDAVHTEIKLSGGETVPFKITYLTAGANGLGWFVRKDVPGALSTLVGYKGMYPFLIDEQGQWKPRDDVFLRALVARTYNNWLNVQNGFGPEIGFGHVVGDHFEEPVLLLKSSQGNRSLGWDFLPPGSERYEYKGMTYAGYKDSPLSWETGTKPEPISWYAGKQYDDCFPPAKAVLDNFDNEFPHWKGRGYEIVGFVWWQGDKDRYNEAHATRYEHNLVHLINTLRQEFDAPEAKFVLGTLGQTPRKAEAKEEVPPNDRLVFEAQMAVDGETGKYPKFKGNVKTVYTHPLCQGGASNGHYDKNAQVYMDVGLSLGQAMIELLEDN